MRFTVDMDPMGAVRMTRRSKWVDETAKRYLNYKTAIGWEARKLIKQPMDTAVEVTILFYYPIPTSWAKMKKQAAREGRIRPKVKPDLDNAIKACLDGMNKIIYRDDSLVVDISSSKWYSDKPRIEIEVLEVSA